MYCSKRFAYSGPVYKARNQLAAIDYTKHLHRKQRKNAQGKLQYHRVYSKHSKTWVVKPVLETKKYMYIKNLMTRVFQGRLNDSEPLSRKSVIPEGDARLISTTIAPMPPPPTEQLVKQRQTRFPKK
ncbi:uncharacterized protein LOC117296331 [Asterias rubens]|uniref:uncharacterized protein LOC117296331 n=1 Tax=Asterias rubens TaxID=7604 RepID=UPI001455AB74|nr:uncharacterized protein LOC117296331 [Asterias rubens]